jgi:hypothetical protein
MFGFEAERSIPSLLVGLILLVLGVVPILAQFKVLSFGLPAFLTGIIPKIALFVIAFGALYMIIDAFLEGVDEPNGIFTLIVGALIFIVGIVNVLNQFGVIGFKIPFLTPLVYNIIFVVEGLFLAIGAFFMQ